MFVFAINNHVKPSKIYLIPLGILLILFAGFRGPNVSSDFETYKDYYELVRPSSEYLPFSFIEPSFVIFSKIFPYLRFVILAYAVLSVCIKLFAFEKLTPFVFYSVALWFSHFFLVLEMNQIRVGVAIGLLLLSIPSIVKRNHYQYVGLVFLAFLFHYSAIIFLPVYILNTNKVPVIYFYVIPAAYLLHFLGIGLIEVVGKLPIPQLQGKMESYRSLYEMGSYVKINVYNPVILLRVGLIYIFLFNWRYLASKNENFVVMIQILVISIVSMLLLASLPAFGLRISDLFGSVEIILLPLLFNLIKEKYWVVLFLFIFGFLIMSIDLLYNQFLEPYSF
ncbi:capsular polysaccharide biosynthesis protein [Arcticibacter svalbardensis MN12-7]|uniref:Capsular polysaccharide biosynthesis protein n=1 Tax=Arcticibacter svalbardensis MN12-7 TaxID=1150600 RepID=R9GYG3_9SPHI|nr:capsular polysaccharide biosynthesis protein [Arcticibacter svalbardensis MN12-7]